MSSPEMLYIIMNDDNITHTMSSIVHQTKNGANNQCIMQFTDTVTVTICCNFLFQDNPSPPTTSTTKQCLLIQNHLSILQIQLKVRKVDASFDVCFYVHLYIYCPLYHVKVIHSQRNRCIICCLHLSSSVHLLNPWNDVSILSIIGKTNVPVF
jgi:hypothetical protein